MYNFSKREQILLCLLLALVIFSGGMVYYVFFKEEPDVAFKLEEGPAVPVSVPVAQEEPKKIMVYVTGAVKNPGVYTLEEGKRVKDAIEAAGGNLPEADLLRLNLAQKLRDEDKLYVPRVGEFPEGQEEPGGGNTGMAGATVGISSFSDNKININTADLVELDTLPGIGPTTAQKIIDYRNQNGPFKSIEEIKNVSGIGDKKFEEIKDKIKVN
ncbi:helix-hairpin-helix domain-containing protein [Thermoanaerobacterium sp. DL9XJH110]|uniref:helix-hairpin-helix domain-containing protein n=1 Tax=Thermoanaerobacterium sp. DL9XJH110 TaxID=3386643 RepID=UPI003BB552FA